MAERVVAYVDGFNLCTALLISADSDLCPL
jgi:hypothetical protein